MSDLLKQSIADAKAVRETALANAKSFLEENFASSMKEMFADKLAEDMTVDTEESVEDSEIDVDGESSDASISNESSCDTSIDEESDVVDEEVVNTEESVEESADQSVEEEVSITNEELDEILSELSSDVEETVAEETVAEETVAEETVAEETVAEETVDEEIDLDEILMELENDMSEVKGGLEETDSEEVVDEEDEEEDYDEDEVDLEEMADALVSINEENDKLKSELSEHIKTVKYLKGVLSETNLLNAKLLYTNKLFRGRSLSENQKLKVIDTFDLTKSIREVKLAYSVLAESFSSGASVASKKTNATAQSITEGLASKAVKSTKPDLIVETKVNDMAQRFQKLAGIVK